MSIWSRNPKDLAKLARTLQGSPDNATRNAQGDPQGLQRTGRPRSLSPRVLEHLGATPSLKTNLDKAKSVSVERQQRPQSEKPARRNDPVNGTVETGIQTQESRVLTTPKLMVTDEEGSSFDALELLETSMEQSGISNTSGTAGQQTISSDFASAHQKKNAKSADDKSLTQKSASSRSTSSEHKGNTLMSTADIESSRSEMKEEKLHGVQKMHESEESVNFMSSKGDTSRNVSPEIVSYQNLSTDTDRLSPRLAARSPELLRKLKEVTSTISSKKAKRGVRRLSTPVYHRGCNSPQNTNMLCTPVENGRPVSPQTINITASSASGTAGILVTPVLKCDVLAQKDSNSPVSLDGSESILFVHAEALLDSKEMSSFCNSEEEAAPCPNTGQKFTTQVCSQVAVKPIAIRINANRSQSGFQKFEKPTLMPRLENGSAHGKQKTFVSVEKNQRERVLAASYVNNQTSPSVHEEEKQDGGTIQHTRVHHETDVGETQCVICHDVSMEESMGLKHSLSGTCVHRKHPNLNSPNSKPSVPNTNTRDRVNHKESESLPGRENVVRCRESTKYSHLEHRHTKHSSAGPDRGSDCSSVVTVVPMTLNSTEWSQEEVTALEDTLSSLHSETETSSSLSETVDPRAVSPVPVPVSPSGWREGGNKSLSPNREHYGHEQRDVNLSTPIPLSPCSSFSSESFLSLLEDGSVSDDFSSLMTNCLMSSPDVQCHGEHTISRKRLKRMVRELRQYNQFLSLRNADPNDMAKTVSELKHLCLSLSKKLEHQHQHQSTQQHQHPSEQLKGQEETRQNQQSQVRDKQTMQKQDQINRSRKEKDRKSNDERSDDNDEEIPHNHLGQVHRKQVTYSQGEHKQKPPEQSSFRQESVQSGRRQTSAHQQAAFTAEAPAKSLQPHRQSAHSSGTNTPEGDVLKTHTSNSRKTKISTLTKSSTAAADSDQSLLEQACRNTPLPDLLGVDKDLLEDATKQQQHPRVHGNHGIQYPWPQSKLRDGRGEGKGKEKDSRCQSQTEECSSDTKNDDFVGEEAEENKGKEEKPEGQGKRESEVEDVQRKDAELRKLDGQFDRMMATVKAHVLKLPQKSDRRRCITWIRNSLPHLHSERADKQKRNMRCKRLLDSLAKGGLHGTSVGDTAEQKKIVEQTRRTEAKYREKLQRLRKDHDSALQKILEQKNREVDNVKKQQINRVETMEQTAQRLQKKVETQTKSLESARKGKDQQISEMEDENSCGDQQSVYEHLIQDLEAALAEETWLVETEQSAEVEQLVRDTDSRLQGLEDRYVRQTEESVRVRDVLGSRLQDLQGQREEACCTCTGLQHDRQQLQQRRTALAARLTSLRHGSRELQKQHQQQQERVDADIKMLRTEAEVCVQSLTRQHTSAASQASEVASDLQHRVNSLRHTTADREEDWTRRVKEREVAHQETKRRLTDLHAEKMDCIKKDATTLQHEMTSKLSHLEQRLRDTDKELERQTKINRKQVQSAARGQVEYRRLAEREQSVRIASLRQQLDQLETEAVKTKAAVEEEKKEFAKRLEEETLSHRLKVREFQTDREKAKAQILQTAGRGEEEEEGEEKGGTRGERGERVGGWRERCLSQLDKLTRHHEERHRTTLKMAEDLLREVAQLAEQLEEGEGRRRGEVEELQQLWGEERQRTEHSHREQIAECRLETDVQCLELQKTRWTEMGVILERLLHVLSTDKMDYARKELRTAERLSEERDISIPSLKSRVNRLQQKADMLQAELTRPLQFSLDWN